MTMISNKLLAMLESSFAGELIVPDQPGYRDAAKVWNGMMDDRQPGLIARATGVADVIAAVRAAREFDVPMAVRGGGHSAAGKSTLDHGMVLDLGAMNHVRVDPHNNISYAGGGALWQKYDHETQPFGVATPGGVISTTGVGGFTLGGGIGWITRKYGLTCDNLVGADVIDAEGRHIFCDADNHPDLLWGLKGGSGNFGVVTTLHLRNHHIGPTIFGGGFLWDPERAPEIFKIFADIAANDSMPKEMGLTLGMFTMREFPFLPPELHWRKVCGLFFCWLGEPTEAERLLKPFIESAPIFNVMKPVPYSGFQRMIDMIAPHGNRSYWKSGYMKTMPDDAIRTVVDMSLEAPSRLSQTEFVLLGGAFAEVDPKSTAFGDRDGRIVYNLVSTWTDPKEDKQNIAWARRIFEALQPYSTDSVYLNFVGEGDDRIESAYGDKFDALSELKARYDPDNFFRHTQNIPPKKSLAA